MKKHWYLITTITCPPCGSTEVIRERQYSPKPEYPETHRFLERYDWCLG